jgi:hypothetical protein
LFDFLLQNLFMPLQNRVNPFSEIIAAPERGGWTGNRGVLHNHQQQIIKHHAVKYWITCVLHYKNKRRPLMTPNRWTELFFLDEATAFAAGHRPCGFCRHADFKKFKQLWLQANGKKYGLAGDVNMTVIDNLIHRERLTENKQQKTFTAVLHTLPDAVFIKHAASVQACLWYRKQLYQWSFGGYQKLAFDNASETVEVLTPASYVEVMRLGYEAQVHTSAKS